MGASARRFDIEDVGIGVLAEAFPLETVRAILKATGRGGKRKRLLPASMMGYYIIALGLFVGGGVQRSAAPAPRWGDVDLAERGSDSNRVGNHASTATAWGQTDRESVCGSGRSDCEEADARSLVPSMACDQPGRVHSRRGRIGREREGVRSTGGITRQECLPADPRRRVR